MDMSIEGHHILAKITNRVDGATICQLFVNGAEMLDFFVSGMTIREIKRILKFEDMPDISNQIKKVLI